MRACMQVVDLLDFFPSGPGFSLVFEMMVSDLAEILKYSPSPLTESQTKSYLVQLLRGLEYCHSCNIMHRDLKVQTCFRVANSGSLLIY
jgi:serine/threonine protein kinase